MTRTAIFCRLKKFIAVMLCLAVIIGTYAPILPVYAAENTANLNLSIWAYSKDEHMLSFVGGNDVSCAVGDTVTFVLRDTEGTYATHALNFNGCELVEVVHICGHGTDAHKSGDWCSQNPVYTFTVRVNSESASVRGDIGWPYDGENTYSVGSSVQETPAPLPEVEETPAPVTMVEQSAETENYIVTVSYGSDLILPEGTELRVMEYAKDSEIFRQRCEEAGYELEWLLNIGLFQGETELELNGGFNVTVTPKQGGTAATDITHFAPEGAQHIEGTDEGNAVVSFETESFSDFGGGIMLLAEGDDATLRLNLYSSWNGQTINGSIISCKVGDTVQIRMSGQDGKFYVPPYYTFSGCEMVSQEMTCGTANHYHAENWCSQGPTYTLTVRITAANASVSGDTKWNWQRSEYIVFRDGQAHPDLPTAVTTGSVNVSALRFYNLCEGDGGVAPLAGCVFKIEGTTSDGQPYSATVTSGETPEVMLPDDIPNGSYTITEISVPDGYMRDTLYERSFVVNDGKFDHNDNIGTYINHDLRVLNNYKTSEVENYNNRIYQVLMEAENHMRKYEMDPVDVLFVVDQSNSMLFPSSLVDTGAKVKLHRDGDWNGYAAGSNGESMDEVLNRMGLDKQQAYYIISDPHGSSTVWVIYWDDALNCWMFQDSSYYAKAKHKNEKGYETQGEEAIFPGVHNFNKNVVNGQKCNGGSLSMSMSGSTLYDYIASDEDGDGDVYAAEFTLYVAGDAYNRLHYLEEAMTNMIYELANANSENRVTLVGFTKQIVDWKDDNGQVRSEGPYELTPDNTDMLVRLVRNINTTGGTRQDIGLRQAFEAHLNDSSESFNRGIEFTHTILITDGAPVKSDDLVLGSPNDSANTSSIYGQIKYWANQIKTKSNLMTIGLGMKDVVGGHQVLNEIASQGHYCALDDAAQLVHEMQQLLFDNFHAKDPIFLYGDIVDEISDSFYPIAWVPAGQGAATGREVLDLQNEPDSDGVFDESRDWIILQPGDYITLQGEYTTDPDNTAGQLLRKDDGTFYIQWLNANISDVHAEDNIRIAWVPKGQGAATGKQVVAHDETRDWILLNAGDWITQDGQYQSTAPDWWNQANYGQLTQSSGKWSVSWGGNTNNGANRQTYDFPGWDATFYLKAKEDFIGGNAIDTNKTAYITVKDPDDNRGTRSFDEPTVNVRLLDMNEMHSEVTVYLGDLINGENAPIDSVRYFWDNTQFTKLVAGDGDVLNKTYIAEGSGLTESTFYLKYALGRELTAEEWQTLVDGGTITIEYTYDDPSSHGPVGYFTFSLEKAGATADYETHTATVPCPTNEGHSADNPCTTPSEGHTMDVDCENPVETYTLNVTYTAYRLGENGRPAENVYNGEGSPGTEVGTGATLPTGAGVVDKNNVHEVHVIGGVIRIIKKLGDHASDANQTFTFKLHRVENYTDAYDETRTITISAGYIEGEASFVGLYRGTYIITEVEESGSEYHLTKIEILDSTNCENSMSFTDADKSVTFGIGENTAGQNVIGKAEGVRYTTYVDPVNGVLGEVVFTNSRGVELPLTGGSGTTMYYFGGLLLMAGALIYGCALRRRNRKEGNV